MLQSDFLISQVQPLLDLCVEQATNHFKERVISIFKFGSLGDRGGFSLCSDVDIAVMLDEIKNEDERVMQKLGDELRCSGLMFADKLSVFWSSADAFQCGTGRFPALDRLDLIQHGILISGTDKRNQLPVPEHKDLILESARFISSFLLKEEKLEQLTKNPAEIAAEGARYFTKFILFPVRLIFTLDNPGVIGSNRDAVTHFNHSMKSYFSPEAIELINQAYVLRDMPADFKIEIDAKKTQLALIEFYKHCIDRYCVAVLALGNIELAQQLEQQKINLVPV